MPWKSQVRSTTWCCSRATATSARWSRRGGGGAGAGAPPTARRPPRAAAEWRRQADISLDIVELQPKIGRDPAERAAREAREPRERHTPQFLQRPTAPQRAGAGAPLDDDDDFED